MVFAPDMSSFDKPAIVQEYHNDQAKKVKVVVPDSKKSKKSTQSYKADSAISHNPAHHKETGHFDQSSDLTSIVRQEFTHNKRESRRRINPAQTDRTELSDYHEFTRKSPEFSELARKFDLKRKHTVAKIQTDSNNIITYNQRGKIIEARPLKHKEKIFNSYYNDLLGKISEVALDDTINNRTYPKQEFSIGGLLSQFFGMSGTAHAARIGSHGAHLRWDHNSDNPDGYRAFWFSGNDMPQKVEIPAVQNQAYITGLDPSKIYTFFVRAFRGLLESGDSNYVTATESLMYPIFVAPEYTIDDFDSFISRRFFTVSGTIDDDVDSVMEVNGYPATVHDGRWAIELDLEEGNYELEFLASNDIVTAEPEYRTINVDYYEPIIRNFTTSLNPFRDGIGIKFDLDEPNLNYARVSLNGRELEEFTQEGEYLSNLPLEFLNNGPNIIDIVAVDTHGNTTTYTETVKLKLDYVAIEAAEKHKYNSSVANMWTRGGWGGVSRPAELSTDEERITEYMQGIKLPFVSIPVNRCVTWTKTLAEVLDLDKFGSIEYDTHSKLDVEESAAAKIEFYAEEGGYHAIKEPRTKKGTQHHVLQVADMLPSGSPNSKIIDKIRIALYNRSDTNVNTAADIVLDRFIARKKPIYDDFNYGTIEDLLAVWQEGSWGTGTPDLELVDSFQTAGNAGNAVRIYYSDIPVNRSVYIDKELSREMNINEIDQISFSVNNPGPGGNIAYKIELRDEDGRYYYHSGTPMQTGVNEFVINGEDLQAKYNPSGKFTDVRIAFFNRGETGISGEHYIELDDFKITRNLITIVD